MGQSPQDDSHRKRLLRTAFGLNVFLAVWNIAEGVIATSLALLAGSVALLGFGIDSAIEVTSSLVLLWRLRHELQGNASSSRKDVESRAKRIAGGLLFLLAVYLCIESLRHLLSYGAEASPSLGGIILTSLSLVVMPVVGVWKLRISQALGSGALRADAFETITCAWLSLSTLIGLILRAWLGWEWADPAAALLLVPLLVREGWEAVSEED